MPFSRFAQVLQFQTRIFMLKKTKVSNNWSLESSVFKSAGLNSHSLKWWKNFECSSKRLSTRIIFSLPFFEFRKTYMWPTIVDCPTHFFYSTVFFLFFQIHNKLQRSQNWEFGFFSFKNAVGSYLRVRHWPGCSVHNFWRHVDSDWSSPLFGKFFDRSSRRTTRRCFWIVYSSSFHSISSEYFLKANWNVIFLHRSSSARPFRHRLDIEMSPEKFVIVQDEYKKSKNRLLEIQFNTLEDYFAKLEKYSKVLENSIASRKMILLGRASKQI